jgi:uncharacterized membrane protein YgaE (UPF0421/DUF939 family)
MKTKMIQVIIPITLAIVLFLIMADTTITFNPFSIKFTSLFRGIGWIVLIIGMALIEYSAQRRGRLEFQKDIESQFEQITRIRKSSYETQEKIKAFLEKTELTYKQAKQDTQNETETRK